MNPSKPERKNLLEGLVLDAPYVKETRRLLQNLFRQQKSAPTEARSYMVTSAARGEGKSTTCALMAIVAARVFRKRTLVVDGDLHRPTLHTLIGVTRGPGLFELMRGTIQTDAAIRATPLSNLWVVSSGYPRDMTSEWYSDEAFRRVLQDLRPRYDIIFVDAPPVVPAIEPILMADHVDSILIVALAGKTPLALVRRSIQVLAPAKDKIAGIVLNNASNGLPYYFNYSYYGYEDTRVAQAPRKKRLSQKDKSA
jgi:capsular exopolysaccharide synthesis family protein